MNNQLTNNPKQTDSKTVILFSEFNYFKNKFTQLYKTVNKKLLAIHKIKKVHQVKSVREYISKYL